MNSVDQANINKQCEILKKRITSMVLKENSKGLNSHETLLKQAAIRQYYRLNHQAHR